MKKNYKLLLSMILITTLSSCEIVINLASSNNNSSPENNSTESIPITDDSSASLESESSYLSESSIYNESTSLDDNISLSDSTSLESLPSHPDFPIQTATPGKSHSDTGTSIELLNMAFNGVESERKTFSNYNKTPIENGTIRTNFTKNVQNLDYNEGYVTPSTGKVNGLVIPVDFSDCLITNNEDRMISSPEWQSVSAFYYNSSYGKLDLSFDILDWYTCKKPSSYYANLKEGTYSGEAAGVSAIIDEALSYYNSYIDLSKYDNNNDGLIDSLYIIYSHDIDYDTGDFWWAYQYGIFEELYFDNVTPYPYMFAGYDFLFEEDFYGEPMICNTHTYIHETGHMFGLVDYYDYDDNEGLNKGGLGGADLMDNTVGDHNAFSKISLGWTNPILVNHTSGYVDIKLKPFEDSGDSIMICDNYSSSKGMFQSYFLLEYYTNTGLHEYDQIFDSDGLRVLRVNAELGTINDGGYSYEYYAYDNSYTNKNLLDLVCADKSKESIFSSYEYLSYCASASNLFKQGDSKTTLYYTSTKTSSYYFEVLSMNSEECIVRVHHK